jgi:hypothetical protein
MNAEPSKTERVRQLAKDFATDARRANLETVSHNEIVDTSYEGADRRFLTTLFAWTWKQIRAAVGIPFRPLTAEYQDLQDAAREAFEDAYQVADA